MADDSRYPGNEQVEKDVHSDGAKANATLTHPEAPDDAMKGQTSVPAPPGGTYGALRVTAELRYGRGINVGHNQVSLIMGRLGIRGLPTRQLPRGARLATSGALDLVRGDKRARLRDAIEGDGFRPGVAVRLIAWRAPRPGHRVLD